MSNVSGPNKPSVNDSSYYPQTGSVQGVNTPPKSPFGGTGIHRTQRTQVCQVLLVPVLMNKWKCLVMSVVIVLCKWCSCGAGKQFLVSRKHGPWELVYKTNLLLQLSLHGLCGGARGPFVRESDRSLIDASSLRSGFWDPKSLWKGLHLRRNVLFVFPSALFLGQAGRGRWYSMESIFGCE